MSKELYWIDDSTKGIIDIVDPTFVKLWNIDDLERGITSKIIILGNNSLNSPTYQPYSNQEERLFQEKLTEIFFKKCVSSYNYKTARDYFMNYKGVLIDNCVNLLFTKEKMDSEKERKKEFDQLIALWGKKAIKCENKEDYLAATQNVENLIKLMNIDSDASIAVDMQLMNMDEEKVKRNELVLSMELYHQLKKKGYKCFLYSKLIFEKDFVDGWKESYQQNYSETFDGVIYSRFELGVRSNDEHTIEKIIDFVEG